MSEAWARGTLAAFAIAAFVLFAGACDDECDCPDCPSGGTADGGVDCENQPGSCGDLGDEEAQHFGCCFEGAVYWCEGGVLESIDCEASGHICGYSETGDFMDCV